MKKIGVSIVCALASVQGLALLSGCGGGGGTGTSTPVPPSISSFTAGSGTIEAGSSTSLTAVFSNGTGVVMPGDIAVTSGTAVTVNPTTTTTYTLTVTGAAGTAPATQTATVTVDPAPAITSFTAGAAAIEAGSSTSLTAVFTGGTGTVSPGNIAVTSGTAVTVSPTATTQYTLTVTPPVGSIDATQTATVTVDPVPTITGFTAATNPITSGGSTGLTAVFSGGTGTITAPGGYSSPAISGTAVNVSPTATTTYTLTVTPPVGTVNATASVTVTVNPGATITSFTATPGTIEAGSSSGLVGYFTGGTGVITAPGGFSSPATSGTAVTVTPASTTTYTLTVTPTGGGTAATAQATVTVSPQPVITSFTASPNPLVAGNSASLTAVFSGGTGVVTPGNITLTSGVASTLSPSPTLTTTYTLTVTPAVGSAVTQTTTLTVEPAVTVCLTPSCSGPKISNLLLGMNLAMWYDDVGNASSILGAFHTAGIAAVRWPGGSDSDEYQWATNSGCGGLNPVADDDFADFETHVAIAGGLDLAVTADYGSDPTCNGPGLASQAANWAAAAVTDGLPIHYMTVGNEEYGSWENDLHTPAADQHNPEIYADEMTGSSGFYTAIKTAVENAGGSASTTLVGVDVDANCTTANGCTDGWDSTVLSQALGSYDFVEYHFYPQSSTDITSDTPLVQQYAQEFTTNINTIKSELATAGAPDTPIYVGEISSNSSNPGTQSWSITQGLYAAQILGEAMNDGVARLTWWIGFGNCLGAGNNSPDLYGWQNTFGSLSIFSDGTTDYPANECDGESIPIGTMSPTAQAFNMFQNVLVAGEYPQTTAVTGDTTDVRAYAATHGTGYALVLFNLNETTAETVSVTLGSESSSTDVTVTTYDKEMYDYTNTACALDPACTYDSTHNYTTAQWVSPATTDLGAQSLPMKLTLQPWSINVVMVK